MTVGVTYPVLFAPGKQDNLRLSLYRLAHTECGQYSNTENRNNRCCDLCNLSPKGNTNGNCDGMLWLSRFFAFWLLRCSFQRNH